MSAIQKRPAIASTFIDDEMVKHTVKFSCRQIASQTDILMLLRQNGVEADEVLELYKGSPTDSGFFVTLTKAEIVDRLRSVGSFTLKNKKFDVTDLGKQIVTVRVHWLPLYFSDSLIKAVFADYGKVISVEKCSTLHQNKNIKNGMRLLKIEVDEKGRRAIPHLIKFECGTSILITIPGRPPLCLRCSQVGHLRRDCVPTVTYAQAAASPVSQQVAQPTRPTEKPAAAETEPVAVEECEEGSQVETQESKDKDKEPVVMETESIAKRRWDDDVSDSFIFPPNKSVKAGIPTENRFASLQNFESLFEEDSGSV